MYPTDPSFDTYNIDTNYPVYYNPTLPYFHNNSQTSKDITSCAQCLSYQNKIDIFSSIIGMFTVVSLATHATPIIDLHRWKESTVIQTMFIGSSGQHKSQFYKSLQHPVLEFQNENSRSEEEIGNECYKATLAKQSMHYLERTYLREKLQGISMAEDQENFIKRIKEITEIAAPMRAAVYADLIQAQRKNPKLFTTTATAPGIEALLQEQGSCVGIFSPEAGALQNLHKDQSLMDLLASGYTQEPYKRARSTSFIEIEKPAIPILVMSQPEAAIKFYTNRILQDKGITARITPCLIREEEHPDWSNKNLLSYSETIKKLLKLYFTQDSTPTYYTISVTTGALNLLDDFESTHSREINEYPELSAWIRKAHGLAVRFAWAFHAWRYEIPHESPIDEDEMDIGIELVKGLSKHVKEMCLPEELPASITAKKILRTLSLFMRSGRLADGKFDSAAMQQRTGCSAVEIQEALKLLYNDGKISVIDWGSRNIKFWFNRNAL